MDFGTKIGSESETQPLSLQDEINLSEENSNNEVEAENSETGSHFRQIFARIFTLLQTSRADEQVT